MGCHYSTYPPMNYEGLVEQDSQQSSLKLIAPNSAEDSYFLHKISGTHLDFGGSGSQMPLGQDPLSSEDIDLVVAWINQGALLE